MVATKSCNKVLKSICVHSPLGLLTLVEKNGKICRINFGRCVLQSAVYGETELLKKTKEQLNQYFNGERKNFTVPVHLSGTPFQTQVWECLGKIPYGETRCYSEIAGFIGNLRACRAVGMANNRNPVPIIIPCHRVVGKDGNLVGYAGGLEIKNYLLELERKFK